MGEQNRVNEVLERLRKLLKELPPEDELIRPRTDQKPVEQQALAVLRALPEEYLSTLPPDLQEKIRQRLARR